MKITSKGAVTPSGPWPCEPIDAKIASLGDWRGELLAGFAR